MDIPGILYRFADNTVTEAERAEFTAYLAALSPEEYEALMEQYEAIDQGGLPTGAADPVVFGHVLEEIDLLEKLEWQRGVAPRRSLFRWTAWAAAACLLLIVGIYILQRPAHPTITTQAAIINPGGNRAVLTLGNGARLILDSFANGRLTRDVVKVADGQLQYQATGKDVELNTLTTPRGGQYQVVLSDGTKVWLNAASAIKYPGVFTGKDREVEVRGEVYLEVARNESHPFKVKVLPGMSVEVLGTSFNINAYQDEVHTTLLEGAVKVSAGARAQVLRPGQQANTSDQNFSIKNDVDLEDVMAWKNGKLVFNKGSIRDLMLEISRWYDVDVRYQGNVPSGGFYGLIDRNVPLTSVLRVLGAYGVKTRMENRTIVVE